MSTIPLKSIAYSDDISRIIDILNENFGLLDHLLNNANLNGVNIAGEYIGEQFSDMIKAETFVVGKNVEMGAESYISWGDLPLLPTAEQVGARPNTWMPTADDVQARPKDWMPTADEVGARPSSWMPTAYDVGALPWDTYIPVVPSYIQSTYIDSTNVISPFISGGVITGTILRTNPADYDRIVLDSYGLATYDDSNQQTGISFGRGTYQYSSLEFYHLGVRVGALEYDGLGTLSLGPLGGANLYIFDAKPIGTWDFSLATVVGLEGVPYKFG